MATTLVTFLFHFPVPARTVEILGSWDNFDRPYHLRQDRRRSSRTWSGCFTFQDIICDGDPGNLSPRRNGALKVGGTYWYYYKVNDEEEHHNPSEPSTTFCPLLPGQRVNILEIPMEPRNGSDSQSCDVFTRNPDDRYLTPVPPMPLVSPSLGDLCREPYSVPMRSLEAPRSATYPVPSRPLSPGFERYVKSASTSPYLASGPVFLDLKALKERVVSSQRPKLRSRERRAEDSVREIQIGAPVLISTTAEEVNLVPLPSGQNPQVSSSLPAHVAAKLRNFSPLGSHPVDPCRDLDFGTSGARDKRAPKRPRSHAPATAKPSFEVTTGRLRANSADTRRTKHYHLFPNEPWISSPRMPTSSGVEIEPAPVSQRPSSPIEPTLASLDERPSSRHGDKRSQCFSNAQVDKGLPALPRYLVPAPLFACNSITKSPVLQEEDLEDLDGDSRPLTALESTSHLSMWSTESMAFSSPTSDKDATPSPTFSSLTSDSSESGSQQRLSGHFPPDDPIYEHDYDCASEPDLGEDTNTRGSSTASLISTEPPNLRLPVPSFGPKLLGIELHHAESKSRRQAACFGCPGSQGYSFLEEEATSAATTTKAPTSPDARSGREHASSVSHLEKLTIDFGFLGQAVH